MATNIEAEYKNAIKDLQEINDKHFYGELKENMNTHLQQLEEQYKKVEEAFKPFINLTDEQKQLITQTSEEWFNLSTKLIESQKETYDMIVGDIQSRTKEQQDGLQESLNAIKREHEQQKEKLNDLLNSLVEEVRQKQQSIISEISEIREIYIETTKTSELQTAAEIETRDMLWQKQKEDLHLVQQTLGKQITLNKKWMIAVGTTQVILAAAIVGLYFF